MSVTVVVEPGACHDGSLDKAKRLIDEAVHCGADAIKWQYWSSSRALAGRRGAGDRYFDTYTRYAMPRRWLFDLLNYAGTRIDTMCSVYLPEDAAVVAPYVRWLKVASFEAQDDALLAAVVATGKPFVVSTGMQNLVEVRQLRNRLEDSGSDYRLLHCVSAYPAPKDALHLSVLQERGVGYVYDGYSDHSAPEVTISGAIAVAAGADVIEAHLRLGSTGKANPDRPHAMTPTQFAEYVQHIRDAEIMLGTCEKAEQVVEAAMATYKVTGAA